MITALPTLLLLAALAADPADGAGAGQSTAAESPAPPQPRVVLHINRRETVAGWVETEDDDVIVVRTTDGEILSWPRSRILEIVRLIDPEPGQRGTVLLRNGQRTEGLIIEDGFEQVVIEVEGIRMRFERSAVARVRPEPGFQERYETYKAALDAGDANGRLALCRWLFQERRYELARDEVQALLRVRPDLPEALRLRTLIDAQLDLAAGAVPPPHDASSEDDERRSGTVGLYDLVPTELITAQDVNRIQVFEIDFDHPPRVAIAPDTIRTLLERYGSSHLLPSTADGRTALFRAEPIDIVRLLFELRAREMYDEIQMLSEPRALNIFRERVHNAWLMNSCATSRCHGGPYAGRFFLHGRNHRNDKVRYTNLLILERLELDPDWPLINYDRPSDSLIIQHGLPREVARRPHPDVPGWRPVFTRGNQRMLRAAIEWIESMMQPRPEYPVEYEPPVMGEFENDVPAEADR